MNAVAGATVGFVFGGILGVTGDLAYNGGLVILAVAWAVVIGVEIGRNSR